MDIIIFAAISVFLLVRLWSVLGRRGDDETQRPNPFVKPAAPSHDDEDVMVLPDRAKALPPPLAPLAHAPASLAGVLDQIQALDPAFDEKKFLQGAKAAFAMIVEEFAKGELARSSRILAEPVLQQFQKVITDRTAAGQTLESHMDRVAEANVVAARLEEGRALLTVDFVSYQINVLRDAQGQIIDGTPNHAEEIHDRWVFAHDMKSDDPNWQLVETRS